MYLFAFYFERAIIKPYQTAQHIRRGASPYRQAQAENVPFGYSNTLQINTGKVSDKRDSFAVVSSATVYAE